MSVPVVVYRKVTDSVSVEALPRVNDRSRYESLLSRALIGLLVSTFDDVWRFVSYEYQNRHLNVADGRPSTD